MALEKPELCVLAEDGRGLKLRAARCGSCGELSFPVTPYGCPICGAPPDQVAEELLSGRAKLLSAIDIHVVLGADLPEPPYCVGEAEIAPGLVCEALLAGRAADYACPEDIEALAVTQTDRDGRSVLTCRFAKCEAAE